MKRQSTPTWLRCIIAALVAAAVASGGVAVFYGMQEHQQRIDALVEASRKLCGVTDANIAQAYRLHSTIESERLMLAGMKKHEKDKDFPYYIVMREPSERVVNSNEYYFGGSGTGMDMQPADIKDFVQSQIDINVKRLRDLGVTEK